MLALFEPQIVVDDAPVGGARLRNQDDQNPFGRQPHQTHVGEFDPVQPRRQHETELAGVPAQQLRRQRHQVVARIVELVGEIAPFRGGE